RYTRLFSYLSGWAYSPKCGALGAGATSRLRVLILTQNVSHFNIFSGKDKTAPTALERGAKIW
ncbi:MAG: hypothetical protein ACI4PC_01805, partial [Oscillospiraceae bacterium]